MKKPIIIALVALCCATPVWAKTPQVQDVQSAGGIKAWLIEDHKLPLVTMQFGFRGGVEYDPADKQGLATLTMALLTQGAGKYDAARFQDELSRHSISLSFEAGRDSLTGAVKTLTKNRELAFHLASLAMTQPRLDPQDFARTKAQQQTAQRMQLSSPDWQARYALYGSAFGAHPYSYRSLGSAQTLAAITRENARAFVAERLAKDRLMIVVVGDISAAQLAPLLDKTFGKLPQTGRTLSLPHADVPASGSSVKIEREGTQVSIGFAAPMIAQNDPAWEAAEVANYILGGGGFESRLMKAVRADKGLTYGVGTGLAPMEKASLIAGSFAVNKDKAATAIDILKKEWGRLVQGGPSGPEVQAAKEYLSGSWPLTLTSTDAIAGVYLGLLEKGLPPDYLDRRNERIQAVDRQAVQAVLQRAFQPEGLRFSFVGPVQDLAADKILSEVKE